MPGLIGGQQAVMVGTVGVALFALYLFYQVLAQDSAEDAGRQTVASISGFVTGGLAFLVGTGFELATAFGTIGDLLGQAVAPLINLVLGGIGAAALAGVIPLDPLTFLAIVLVAMIVGAMIRN